MDLYFSPLACSLAGRISLYEAKGEARYIEVDPKTKRTMDEGADYTAIYPLGLVPLLRLDDRSLLAENAAILQYIAAQYPKAGIGAASERERAYLQQWLCFIGTELHKALFIPLFAKNGPEGAKEHALSKGESRLAYLNDYLTGREFLLDHFSVADAYLFTVLNWSMATPVDLERWPTLNEYYKRLRRRPSVERAFNEEFALYKAELARHKAAA